MNIHVGGDRRDIIYMKRHLDMKHTSHTHSVEYNYFNPSMMLV